jgi:hypothetical protein
MRFDKEDLWVSFWDNDDGVTYEYNRVTHVWRKIEYVIDNATIPAVVWESVKSFKETANAIELGR